MEAGAGEHGAGKPSGGAALGRQRRERAGSLAPRLPPRAALHILPSSPFTSASLSAAASSLGGLPAATSRRSASTGSAAAAASASSRSFSSASAAKRAASASASASALARAASSRRRAASASASRLPCVTMAAVADDSCSAARAFMAASARGRAVDGGGWPPALMWPAAAASGAQPAAPLASGQAGMSRHAIVPPPLPTARVCHPHHIIVFFLLLIIIILRLAAVLGTGPAIGLCIGRRPGRLALLALAPPLLPLRLGRRVLHLLHALLLSLLDPGVKEVGKGREVGTGSR